MVFKTTNGLFRQLIAGCSASLSAIAASAVIGWMAQILPTLLGAQSYIPMTAEDASWLMTMPQFGILVSSIPAGTLSDHFGRKSVLLMSAPLFLTGWIIILYFRTVVALRVARLIQGLAAGIVYSVLPVYLGEIATPKFRGMLLSLYLISLWFGYLFEYITGSMLPFTSYTYVTASINVIFLLTFTWQPESPYYFILKDDTDRARETLAWLSSDSDEIVDADLSRMKQAIEEDRINTGKWSDILFDPTNRKSFVIMLCMSLILTYCGLVPLIAYSTDTLTMERDDFVVSPKIVTVVIGAVMFAGSFISFFILDIFPRVSIFWVNSLFSGLCMLCVGTYYLFKHHSAIDLSCLSWVPSTGFIIFALTCSLGMYSSGAAYCTELMETNLRARAAGLMILYSTVICILPLKLYIPIESMVGNFLNFYIFAGFCFSGLILSCFLPETKGKSFEQIRSELKAAK